MTLRASKRYTGGATQTAYVSDAEIDRHVAKVNAEDADAGLTGTWDITVRRVDGRLV